MPAHHYQPYRDWPVDIRGEGLHGIFLDELQTVVAWHSIKSGIKRKTLLSAL